MNIYYHEVEINVIVQDSKVTQKELDKKQMWVNFGICKKEKCKIKNIYNSFGIIIVFISLLPKIMSAMFKIIKLLNLML